MRTAHDSGQATSHARQHAQTVVVSTASGEAIISSSMASRFELRGMLYRQDLQTRRIHHQQRVSQVADPVELPGVIKYEYGDDKFLFAGSFGEAWQAVERTTGRYVVLKMFYKTENGIKSHVTWREAESNTQLRKSLHDATGECKLAQKMQINAGLDTKGASRLMKCHEDRVTLCPDCDVPVGENDVLYQVLEDCTGEGGMPLTQWMQSMKQSVASRDPEGYLKSVLQIFKQFMEGLRYLTRCLSDRRYNGIGFVHHDLKPENILIKKTKNQTEVVKFIDYGAATEISQESCTSKLISTRWYAPPEWFSYTLGYSCSNPASFDIYSVAVILDEMITGRVYYLKMAREAGDPDEKYLQNCTTEHPWTTKQCRDHYHKHQVKLKDGVEYNISSQAQLRTILLMPGRVSAPLVNTTHLYEMQADSTGWWYTYMQMIAYDYHVRPSAAYVLESRFMQNQRDTFDDPDYFVGQRRSPLKMRSVFSNAPRPKPKTAQQQEQQPQTQAILSALKLTSRGSRALKRKSVPLAGSSAASGSNSTGTSTSSGTSMGIAKRWRRRNRN